MENEWTKEIDRLQVENDRLREALQAVESIINGRWATPETHDGRYGVQLLNLIRTALADINGEGRS